LVGFAKRIGGREIGRAMVRLIQPRFKFKFESYEEVFENPPNWFPRVSNISNKSKPRFDDF
jgi:hypothetical protein